MKALLVLFWISGLCSASFLWASNEEANPRKSVFFKPPKEVFSEGDQHIVIDSKSFGNHKISLIEIYKQNYTPEDPNQRLHGTLYVYPALFYLKTEVNGKTSQTDVIWGTRLELVAISDKKCWITSDSAFPRNIAKIYEVDFREPLPQTPKVLPREPLLDFFDKCGLLFSRPGNRVSYSVSEDGETLILTPHKPGKQPEDFPVKEFVYKVSPEQTESEMLSDSSERRENSEAPASEPESGAYNVAGGILGPIAILGALFIWRQCAYCRTKKTK